MVWTTASHAVRQLDRVEHRHPAVGLEQEVVVAQVPRLGRALRDQAVGAKKWCGGARVPRPVHLPLERTEAVVVPGAAPRLVGPGRADQRAVHLLDPQTTGSGDPGPDGPGVLQPLADVVDDQLQAPPPPRRGARQGTERLKVLICHISTMAAPASRFHPCQARGAWSAARPPGPAVVAGGHSSSLGRADGVAELPPSLGLP